MKIGVTGASGQLGTAVIKNLLPIVGKESIVGTGRNPDHPHPLGIEMVKGDYNHQDDFDKAFQGVEVVLILSASGDPKGRVRQHQNVINGAKACGVRKLVYTSILPEPSEAAFNAIINSNRQTESDIVASGLEYIIGRNGIYLEPDLEYLDSYIEAGKIVNCAGDGKCAYTSRDELGYAYAQLLTDNENNGETFNLSGQNITQSELADLINQVYGTQIVFEDMSVEAYLSERQAELGDFMGEVIAGIYHGIRNGDFNLPSHYQQAAGRSHKPLLEIIKDFKRTSAD